MSLPVSAKLGAYVVGESLGAGGMGIVYRARDTRLGRSVAIKILPDGVADDPERIARFEREARALAALHHPHIAALFGMRTFKWKPSRKTMGWRSWGGHDIVRPGQ